MPWEVRQAPAVEVLRRVESDRAAWMERALRAEAERTRLAKALQEASAQRDTLLEEKDTLAKQLRARYAALRLENKDLRAENAALHVRNEVLQAEGAVLQAENARLVQENKDLKQKLEEARRAGRRQAAPFGRRKREEKPKKPGRKPGHAPAHRPVPDHVDADVDVPLGACPHCGGEVDEEGTHEQYSVDIPPVRPHVTKFTNHYGCCKRCGRRAHRRHPDQTSTSTGAASVVLGPQVLAVSIDLKERVGVPYRKVAEVLLLCFQFEVSAGALVRAAQRITKRCEPTYEALLHYLRRSAVVHSDETGWYIANAPRKAWLWVFATPEGVTIYAIRLSRGGDVPEAILGETFAGKLVVDGWAVYGTLGYPLAQCNTHLIHRAVELLDVQRGEAATFPLQVKELLQGGIILGRSRSLVLELWGERFWQRAVSDTEQALTELLAPEQSDPDNQRFRNHLLAHQGEVLAYLHDPAVAPTNSLAEREIRPAVVVRKVSAGNRTEVGAHVHEVLASLTRTASRGRVRITDLVPELLRSPTPIILAPGRFGLPPQPVAQPPIVDASTATPTHAASPTDPGVRPDRRRVRRVDRAHHSTAPP